ncbi:MAG: secretin N-terminal domain-containing protein [Planctomycetaceae bacterium]
MLRDRLALPLAAVLAVCVSAIAAAQEAEVKAATATASEAKPEPGKPTPGKPGEKPMPGGSPMGEQKPGEQKPGEKPGEKKPDEATPPAAVTRPAKPAFTVDPKELEIQPVDGKVRFNFHGQPWQAVLEWLAGISGLSLDWQELPGDFLNLRTQRAYTLDEARDLLNQQLLARGYTMLRHGEVLTVVKLDKLDPALVPQVEPDELESRDLHEFVQTTFELDWIPAHTAEEELKPLLSPKGKLTKLSTTNRLHAVDAVVNLLAIRDLLKEEQSGRGLERLVKSFKLEHARADDVKKLLEEFLGVAEKDEAMPADPRQMQMRMQMMQMQQQQRQQQQQGQQPGGAQPPPGKISIIANPRENEIIAQAPPEEMAIIEQTVELLDAPPAAGDTLERQLLRVRVFRLAQLDPETLVTLLEDMGGLSPQTKLTPDKKNRSLLVNGPVVDHVVIQQVVERMDGSDRSFDVIPLRRLPADYVAGTIRFMLGEEEEDDSDSRRRSYYYYDPWGSNEEEEEGATGKFRVDADVENNRLLIWANEIEMEEVHNLLVKLGEVRPTDGERSTVRVLNLSEEQATEFLKRLEQTWTADETHPLIIEPAAAEEPSNAGGDAPSGDPFAPKDERTVPQAPDDKDDKPVTEPGSAVTTSTDPVAPAEPILLALSDEAPAIAAPATGDDSSDRTVEPEAGAKPPEQAPAVDEAGDPFVQQPRRPTPVKVRRGPDGRLIVTADDPQALDAVEDLMYELAPPPKEFEIFHLKYPTTWAWGVALNLEDFFGVNEEESGDDDYFRGYFGYSPSSGSDDAPLRLSQRRELKFIADEDSRTILVQGATPDQLDTIRELIELYDKPLSQMSGDLRITKLFEIKHAKAETIANAIKDVYRDLLSTNDRALQNNNNKDQQQRPAERSYTYVIGGGGDQEQPAAPIKFKGLLSIGIDEDSNTLVVSSSESLMDDLSLLIESLDLASKQKEAVSVVRTGGGGVPTNLSGRLKEIFGDKITIVGEEAVEETASE